MSSLAHEMDVCKVRIRSYHHANKQICDWIYGNRSKSHIGSYEIIDFKDFNTLASYNQQRTVSTQTYPEGRLFHCV